MLFTFICTDKADSLQIRKDARPAHIEYLDAHVDQLIYGGPLFGADNETPIGSLIIAEVDDREAAEKFADDDPYNQAGLFESVVISSSRQVYPKG
ncbi:MAG: YciI family protein [Verrucomicrobiia bacterium]